MDPDQALDNARRALSRYLAATAPHSADTNDGASAAADLADAFEALDGWLSKGGFLPAAWSRPTQDEPPTDNE